jgi:hypothetical protein
MAPMPRPLEVRPLKGLRLWLRYDDGVKGEVDLSHLAGRGVFRAWAAPQKFESVRIGPQGQITWGDDLELCADALYLKVTGKTPEQMFPALKKTGANA